MQIRAKTKSRWIKPPPTLTENPNSQRKKSTNAAVQIRLITFAFSIVCCYRNVWLCKYLIWTLLDLNPQKEIV